MASQQSKQSLFSATEIVLLSKVRLKAYFAFLVLLEFPILGFMQMYGMPYPQCCHLNSTIHIHARMLHRIFKTAFRVPAHNAHTHIAPQTEQVQTVLP